MISLTCQYKLVILYSYYSKKFYFLTYFYNTVRGVSRTRTHMSAVPIVNRYCGQFFSTLELNEFKPTDLTFTPIIILKTDINLTVYLTDILTLFFCTIFKLLKKVS